MAGNKFDPIDAWFTATEELGEYIGIRFGHLSPGAAEPDWMFPSHREFDGIGGFAEILRKRGAVLARLPQIKHPTPPSRLSLLRSIPKFLMPKHPLKWVPFDGEPMPSTNSTPPKAFAWHLFDEATTTQVRRACRKRGVTVNSFVLKHLTKAIRPFLQDESSVVPWMMPVNLRGKIFRGRDTTNYSGYVVVKVRSYETVKDIHHNIYASLGRGEHWANWYAYESAHILSAGMRKYLVASGKAMAEWSVGGFSNLGDWDPEKKITSPDCQGGWLFCPPVLRCQLIGTGCLTFQNRLALVIQIHPELTTSSVVPRNWIQNWVKEIEIDLSSLLSDSPNSPASSAIPSYLAA